MNSLPVAKCRFIEWSPLPIEALSFSPDGLWLAVCNSNAEILIFNPTTWQLVVTIPGSSEGSIRNICWAPWKSPSLRSTYPLTNYNLITTGLDGKIILWNLHTLKKRCTLDSHGGAIFDSKLSPNGKFLAIACDDGATRLYTVSDDEIVLYKSLTRLKGRALSLCWYTDDTIFVGSTHSTILRYNTKTGTSDLKMKVDKHTPKMELIKGEDVQIWCLLSLTNSKQIISGDSSGRVIFWNTDTCTQFKSFKELQADVLTMAASLDERYVVASGVDPKILALSSANNTNEWMVMGFKHAHSNDIRSITLSSKRQVASGGLDSFLCLFSEVAHISDIKEKPLRFNLVPPNSSQWISFSAEHQLALFQSRNYLELWSLVDSFKIPASNPIKAAVIRLSDTAQISASDLSPDGQLVAVSNCNGTRLFGIDLDQLEIGKVDCPKLLKHSAYSLKFISKDTLAICYEDTSFYTDPYEDHFCLLVYDAWNLKELAFFDDLPNPIIRINVSNDSQWMSTIDTEGVANIYNLDSMTHFIQLPTSSPDGACTCTAFRSGHNQLAVFTANKSFYIYDLDKRCLKNFKSEAGSINKIPDHLLRCSDGSISDSIWLDFEDSPHTSQSYLLCQTSLALCTINLNETYSENPVTISEDQLSMSISRRWYDLLNVESLQLFPRKRLIPESLCKDNLGPYKKIISLPSSNSNTIQTSQAELFETRSDLNSPELNIPSDHSLNGTTISSAASQNGISSTEMNFGDGNSLLKNHLSRRKYIVDRRYKHILGFKHVQHKQKLPSASEKSISNHHNQPISNQIVPRSNSLFLFSIPLKKSNSLTPSFTGKKYGV